MSAAAEPFKPPLTFISFHADALRFHVASRSVFEVRHNFRCCCTSWPWSTSASTGAMAYDEALSQDMSTLLRYKVGCASRQENIFLFRFNFGATDTQRPHGLHSRGMMGGICGCWCLHQHGAVVSVPSRADGQREGVVTRMG